MVVRGSSNPLHDLSQRAPQCVFHQSRLPFSARDLADIGGIDAKLTTHPPVKSSELGRQVLWSTYMSDLAHCSFGVGCDLKNVLRREPYQETFRNGARTLIIRDVR